MGIIKCSWLCNYKYYGEVMLNAIYYLPSQFIGYYLWNKHQNKKTKDVIGKKLNLKSSIILLLVCTLGIFGYKFILDILGGNSTPAVTFSANTV